jgi:hypothetical protein
MEVNQGEVVSVAHAIQLSVAPVFLLSGIGVFLGVLTNRLARVVDRARPMEQRLATAPEAEAAELKRSLAVMARRGRLINRSITLGTIAALLVALVVALLFASAFVRFSLVVPVAGLFITSMMSLVGALVAFLVEVRVATAALRIGQPR